MNKLSRLLCTVLLFLSSSAATMAAPFTFALPDPDIGGPDGSRYAFTWSGELQGLTDPYTKFNDQKFTLSGFYFSNGTFEITQLELPEPSAGGGGFLVALPNPDMGGPGSLFLPPPDIGGPTGIIRFEFTPPELGGSPSARSLSLYFNDTAADFRNTNSSYQAAPVPEPSTILLFAAGLAGLTAIGRRRKA
jgi:hypothetical protein